MDARMSLKRILALLAIFLLSSCASLSNRSTGDLIDSELGKQRKIVRFESTMSVSSLENGLVGQDCGRETVHADVLVRAGPGTFVPVRSSGKFSVHSGASRTGGRWVGLRMDGVLHLLASGVELEPRSGGGTTVSVLLADRKKVDRIKQLVEQGTLFCHWREVDYPYD